MYKKKIAFRNSEIKKMTSHTARRRKREERRKKLGLPRRPNIEHQDSQEKPEEKTDKSKYKDEQINLRKVFRLEF